MRPVKPDLLHTSCRSESSNVSLIILDKVAKALLCYHLRLVCWMISLAVIEEKGLENIEIYSQDDELQLIWCIKYPREYRNMLSGCGFLVGGGDF